MEPSAGGSADKHLRYTRKQVFIIVKDHLKCALTELIKHLEEQITKETGRPIRVPNDSRASFSVMFSKMRSMWQRVDRTEKFFFNRYKEWLNAPVLFHIPSTSEMTSINEGGNPSRESASASEGSKRRKTEEIRSTFTSNELAYATQMSLRSAEHSDDSKVAKERATLTSSSRSSKDRTAFESTGVNTLSEDDALSFLIECNLSKAQYEVLRSVSTKHHCQLYPPYRQVVRAKNRCYPLRTAIRITESTAEVRVQDLLDHTVERILLLQNNVIRNLAAENVSKMDFVCKWSCESSSGQSEYNQIYEDDVKSDAHVFFTSMVPLQLLFVEHVPDAKIVVWKNPRPSSPRFCRPLRMQFLREDNKSITNEVQHIKEQINSLIPFETVINGKEISIVHNMAFTMVDGKVCDSDSSSTTDECCHLCGAKPKEFNAIDDTLQRKIDETNLKFDLSILHAWTRFLECCLDVSYNLTIKKWEACGAEEKKLTEDRKRIIQKRLNTQLGLIADRPNPEDGISNDGNTARRFFEDATVCAAITEFDESLVKRFYVILQVLSSGREITYDKFQEYGVDTARQLVRLYPWYYMSTAVHKLLIHGPQIIAHALLPIGQLDDAQAARIKDIERHREDLSQECSRMKTMEDVFDRLIVTSDPYISSMQKVLPKKLNSLSLEAVQLLVTPTPTASSTTEQSFTSGSDSENDSDATSDINWN